MPENDNKTLTPQEIEEQKKIAKEKALQPINANLPKAKATIQGPSAAEQAITKAYDDNIKATDLLISDWEGKKARATKQDETAQRKARNMQMIAGISDGLTSLANLIGVAHGGTNIEMGTGALTPFQQKMEAARLERKADIKSIDDRLEQYRNQMRQMQMAKGTAVAQQKAAEAERTFKTSERVAGEKHAEKMLDKKIVADAATSSAKLQSDAYQKALDRSNAKDVARIRAEATEGNKRKPEQFTLTGADGKEIVYNIPAETAEAIMRDFNASIEADLAADTTSGATSSEFRKAYEKYQDISKRRGLNLATDQQVKDARNELIEASPTLRKKIESYGSASKWSNWES